MTRNSPHILRRDYVRFGNCIEAQRLIYSGYIPIPKNVARWYNANTMYVFALSIPLGDKGLHIDPAAVIIDGLSNNHKQAICAAKG